MTNIKLSLLVCIIVAASGCKKEFSGKQDHKQVNVAKVFKLPSTPQEKLLVYNLGKVTEVMQELYKDNSNLKLVNAAVFSKVYTDESILLKDLIYPDESRLNANAAFSNYTQKWNISLRRFAKNFWEAVNRKDDQAFVQFLHTLYVDVASLRSTDATISPGSNEYAPQVSIYFPYSDRFIPANAGSNGSGAYTPSTTIATATADADEGWAGKPQYQNGILQDYLQVLLNDEYAYTNPTQIVGINGVEPYDAARGNYMPFQPGDPIDLANLPREIKQVYIGEVKIQGHQFDHLISFTGNGGGSEIRFTRADGFLKVADEQVTLADVYFTPAKEITRASIRNESWIDFSLEWDGDWEASNLQQNLAIYEEDNRNSSEFSGQISTTLKLFDFVTLAVGPIGFKLTYRSDDELIRQVNCNRDVFFVLNRTNLEGEMRNGVPVRDKNGLVSYTLKDRTYY